VEWAILITDEQGKIVESYSSLEEVNEDAMKIIATKSGDLIISRGAINLEDLIIFGRNQGPYNIFLAFKGNIPGVNLISKVLFESISKIDDPHEIKNFVVSFMRVKIPDLKTLLTEISTLLKKALSIEMIKYSLKLRSFEYYEQYQLPIRPFKVINFEDGFKRAMISAFNGDFVNAYNLITGALRFKEDNLARLVAVYLGYLLLINPYTYPAPKKEELENMLNNIIPKNEIETFLKEFELRLLKGLRSYGSSQDAMNLLKKNIDKLFEIIGKKSEDELLKDFLAFILITFEPSILSSQKINFLIEYIGNRSFFLNEYLKAAINRLRTWSIMIALDIPWKDIIGNIRRLRSQFINSKVDLLDVIKSYELDINIKKVRDNLVGAFMNMIEYLRLLYWSMSLKETVPQDLKEFLPEALFESYEIFKMIIDAIPPISLETIIDSAYIFSSIAYISRGLNENSFLDILRVAHSVSQSILEIVSINTEFNRLSVSAIIRAIPLIWVSLNIASLLDDIPPFTLKALEAIIPKILEIVDDIREKNIERYLLLDFFMRMIKANMMILINAEDNQLFKMANELIEEFYSFIKAGAFIPLLCIPLADIINMLSQKIKDDSLRRKLKDVFRDVIKFIVEEEISPVVKNILLKTLGI